jgi:hypothetical protein
MDSAKLGTFIAQQYSRTYFPAEVGGPFNHAEKHVRLAIKTWYGQRNKICHEEGYTDELDHKKFIARSEYVYELVEDLWVWRERPSIDFSASITDYSKEDPYDL